MVEKPAEVVHTVGHSIIRRMELKEVSKKLESVPIGDIKINTKNWRRHSRKQRQLFQESVAEVGYITPIIWNRETGNLIDGELRYTEMKQSGAKTIEAIVVELPPEEEAKVLALLDQVSSGADIDPKAYAQLVQDIMFEREKLNKDLKLKFAEAEEEKIKIEHAEFELVPEMLVEYDYVLLVFKDPVNILAARDIFGVGPRIDRYNGRKGDCKVVDGDEWLKSREK